MVNSLNWFEIPATDFERAKTFYAKVLDAQIHDDPKGGRLQFYKS